MKKTTFVLDEDFHRELKHLAIDEGCTMAELLERAVKVYVKWKRGMKKKTD